MAGKSGRPRAEHREPPESLEQLRTRAKECRACPLWRRATQTVFGGGAADAELMLVGEQPGDQEDRAGEPFVGAAGRVLAKALDLAGIDPSRVYITNAVKHFKWSAKGKRRIHERPNREEILACRMWLDAEIALVRPKALVALGATAASVLAGTGVRVTRDRGRLIDSPLAEMLTVTVHPSSILRTPAPDERREAMARFVADLKAIARRLRSRARASTSRR